MARLRLRAIPVLGIGVWARGSRALGQHPWRSLSAGRTLAAGAVLTGLALLGASVPASAQALTWSVVSSPNPGTSSNFLYGVSCASAGTCTAVGFKGSATLVESWNGTSWSVVPSPSPGSGDVFGGVSCASAAACTAAGGYYNSSDVPTTLVESWNGTSWSVVPSPNPGSGGSTLSGVSCVSAAACTAVGTKTSGVNFVPRTLIESWNGTSWSAVPSPNRGSDGDPLSGVSCVSAAACTAVGPQTSGVGCVRRTLIESWNGTSWSVVPSPSPGSGDDLGGVSCVSAAACTAVGYYSIGSGHKTLIESWDGTSWSVVPSPNVAPNDYLDGVSCASTAACTAVGYYFAKNGDRKTLIESWNGTSWSVVPSPNLLHNDHLYGVSCASAAGCTAVGYYYDPSRTLIESGTASG
jgi:hypothetical protein